MADAIEIFLNLSTPAGSLVKGLSDRSPFPLGPFYQGSLLPLRIYPVVETGVSVASASNPLFAKVPITTMDLQVAVGPRAGAEAILAAQYTWAKQLTNDAEGKSGYFYANLDLNTSALNSAISTSDTLATFFEILISRAGAAFAPVFQSALTVLSVVKGPGSAASIPTPTESYLTAAQCYNLFVAWRNDLIVTNAGRNLILLSPDGTRTRELGVDNDAAPIDNAS